MKVVQVNVRVDEALAKALDEKRVKLQDELGKIPSRSEVIRMALEAYLPKKGRKR